ncbi:hypothetical protein QFZ77_001883 [Paenibacillus sp. V4I3]|uniref:glycosyl hydrolase n=1 Tax=Paenibacillus sp. V4I3 TaxID=3042305 RepID=UPI002780454C|nr:glycosyl hydrolase [Paenibacillus sp. V4I3]MDQ0873224.1 hypothetical protein [Paenibacillus sp. V4I3]
MMKVRSWWSSKFKYRIIVLVCIGGLLIHFPAKAMENYLFTAFEPVNANATPEAKELLTYLYSLKGKSMLTGQHDFLEDPDVFVTKIKAATGKDPIVHGYEMGGILGQNETTLEDQRQKVVNSAIEWHKSGGIVTMMYHASYPGMQQYWNNVQRATKQEEFDQIVTDGTSLNKQLISDIDKVAVYLKQLKDAGVPVLWRPYHEMNGNWFWWGKKSNYVRLWNIMFDRYVNVHGLNNLLWVWNPNAPSSGVDPYANTYPGSSKVDALAVDIYNNDYKQSYHDELWELGGGKPIGIGENGEMPNESILSSKENKYVWFMTWGEMLETKNSASTVQSLYGHHSVITRHEHLMRPSMIQLFSFYGYKIMFYKPS